MIFLVITLISKWSHPFDFFPLNVKIFLEYYDYFVSQDSYYFSTLNYKKNNLCNMPMALFHVQFIFKSYILKHWGSINPNKVVSL